VWRGILDVPVSKDEGLLVLYERHGYIKPRVWRALSAAPHDGIAFNLWRIRRAAVVQHNNTGSAERQRGRMSGRGPPERRVSRVAARYEAVSAVASWLSEDEFARWLTAVLHDMRTSRFARRAQEWNVSWAAFGCGSKAAGGDVVATVWSRFEVLISFPVAVPLAVVAARLELGSWGWRADDVSAVPFFLQSVDFARRMRALCVDPSELGAWFSGGSSGDRLRWPDAPAGAAPCVRSGCMTEVTRVAQVGCEQSSVLHPALRSIGQVAGEGPRVFERGDGLS
jgi:hypothetical protein